MLNQQLNLVAIPGCKGYSATTTGRIYSHKTKRFLTLNKTTHGYLKVTLSLDKVYKNYSVHRLIALTFLDNPNNYPCVNHKDGCKTNNNLNNLEWCTYSHNLKHAYTLKSRVYKNKKSRNQYSGTREKIKDKVIKYRLMGLTFKEIGKLLDVSDVTVGKIVQESSETREIGNIKQKLTEEEVIEIYKSLEKGFSQKDLSIKYNVSQMTISLIKNKKIYKNVIQKVS